MIFNSIDIMHYACQFANEMLLKDIEKDVHSNSSVNLTKENLLSGKYGISAVNNLILGAILEYHNQLRQCLISEHSIDIGAFDAQS